MKITRTPTIWLTGLPSSGKSTIAQALKKGIRKRNLRVEILDGDIIRSHLWNDLGFSKKDRIENLRRVIYLADLLTRNGVVTIVSFISPYRSIRDEARRKLKNFFEIYIQCPIEVCMKRDKKGLYEKAKRGGLKNFTGISHPYEEPLHPEVVVRTDKISVRKCVQAILPRVFGKMNS